MIRRALIRRAVTRGAVTRRAAGVAPVTDRCWTTDRQADHVSGICRRLERALALGGLRPELPDESGLRGGGASGRQEPPARAGRGPRRAHYHRAR